MSTYKNNFSTDQIIWKPNQSYVFKVYAPDIAFSMSINILSYLCLIQNFIYRSIMSDSIEPVDIEGEAVCAVGPQLVTAEGEKGAGVDVKRTSSHLKADNLLTSDNGEPTEPGPHRMWVPLRKRAGAQSPRRSSSLRWWRGFEPPVDTISLCPWGEGKAHVFCKRRLKTNETTSLNLSQDYCLILDY